MRIKKSKLLMTFERLCEALEKPSLQEIDVCAMHTKFALQTAYTLSVANRNLFVVLTADERPRHVRLIMLSLKDLSNHDTQAKVFVVPEQDITTMAFMTSYFFYEALRTDNIDELYRAFPGVKPSLFHTDTPIPAHDLQSFLA